MIPQFQLLIPSAAPEAAQITEAPAGDAGFSAIFAEGDSGSLSELTETAEMPPDAAVAMLQSMIVSPPLLPSHTRPAVATQDLDEQQIGAPTKPPAISEQSEAIGGMATRQAVLTVEATAATGLIAGSEPVPDTDPVIPQPETKQIAPVGQPLEPSSPVELATPAGPTVGQTSPEPAPLPSADPSTATPVARAAIDDMDIQSDQITKVSPQGADIQTGPVTHDTGTWPASVLARTQPAEKGGPATLRPLQGATEIVRLSAPNDLPTPVTETAIRAMMERQDTPDDTGVDQPEPRLPAAEQSALVDLPLPDPGTLPRQMEPSLTAPTHGTHLAAKHLHLSPEAVIPQIVDRASRPATDPVEIVLNPQELGHLRFEIRHNGDQVTVVMTAERADTLDLMRRHSDQLLTDLRQSGFSDASLSFGQWAQNEGGQSAKPLIEDLADHSVQSTVLPPTVHWSRLANLGGQGLNLRL